MNSDFLPHNQSTIAICENPVHHARVKHVEIKMQFIRENITDQEIKLVWCPTELMLSDMLTKPLPATQHWKLIQLMGMRTLSEVKQGLQGGEQALTTKWK